MTRTNIYLLPFLVLGLLMPGKSLPCAQHPGATDSLQTVIVHGSRHRHDVALTFDACSTHLRSGFDPRIPATLTDSGVPATLFLGGKWILDHPAEARTLGSSPLFEIGNHSMFHPHFTSVTDSVVARELARTQALARKYSARTPTLFRPPYGEWDRRTVRIADSLGLRVVLYDLPSGDPDTSITLPRLVRYVVRSARNGSIIVMHMNGKGVHTAEALPAMIEGLRDRGFRFVKVSELAPASPLEP